MMTVDILYGAVVSAWLDANLTVGVADGLIPALSGIGKLEREMKIKMKLREIKLAVALILPLPDVS